METPPVGLTLYASVGPKTRSSEHPMVAPTRDVARRRLLRPRSGASALAEARDWGPAHDADVAQ